MTEPENPDVPDFEDVSYAEIRALLADAAASEPMPADVATSLDDVLAGLVAERAAETDDTVVPIRRRALVARRLLVAAAAVVLVGAGGVGVNQVLQDTNTSKDSTASSTTADRELAPEAPAVSGAVPQTASGDQATIEDSLGELALGYSATRGRLAIQFTRARFAKQVTRLVTNADATGPWFDASVPPPATEPSTPAPAGGASIKGAPTAPAAGGTASSPDIDRDVKGLNGLGVDPQCPGPPATDGVIVVPITFEGHPATLAVHPVVGGSRYVAAWSCDGHRLLAYATVPG